MLVREQSEYSIISIHLRCLILFLRERCARLVKLFSDSQTVQDAIRLLNTIVYQSSVGVRHDAKRNICHDRRTRGRRQAPEEGGVSSCMYLNDMADSFAETISVQGSQRILIIHAEQIIMARQKHLMMTEKY